MAGKDGEEKMTSEAENKCQPETELEKLTTGMQNAENQETTKVTQDNLDKEKGVEDNFDAKQKEQLLEKPVQTEVNENFFKMSS